MNQPINKKAITLLVATALILILAVISVIGFQNWYQTYSITTFTNLETQNQISNLKVEKLINNKLFLKNNAKINLTLLKINDKNGNEICNFADSTTLNSNNLVGWWTFNEIKNNGTHNYTPDSSPLKNHIYFKYNTNQPKLIPSKHQNALKFDGINDYGEIHATGFNLTNNFTIFIQLNSQQNGIGRQSMFSSNGDSGEFAFEIGNVGNPWNLNNSIFINSMSNKFIPIQQI